MTKSSKARNLRRYRRGVREFQQQTKGRHEMMLVRWGDPTLIEGAERGEEKAIRILKIIAQFHYQFRDPKQWVSGSPMCVTCDHNFAGADIPAAVLINLPLGWETRACPAIASAVCPTCADADSREIFARAAARVGGYATYYGNA